LKTFKTQLKMKTPQIFFSKKNKQKPTPKKE